MWSSCRDVASFIDDRFDNCDLLWGGVIHDRTINAAVIISTQLSKIVAAGLVMANQEDKVEWVAASRSTKN
jgi:hypothetical protein